MRAHILVVDDEPDVEALILQKFRHKIRDGAITFLFARDGVEALAALKANGQIDVVVTDINMPRMDGLSLLRKLQENENQVSTIVVSAYGHMSNIRTAMNRGPFDFVTKPIDFQDLQTTIAKTIRHIELLRDARQRQAVAERDYASLSRYFSPNLAQQLASDTDAVDLAVNRHRLRRFAGTVLGRLVATQRVVHIADVRSENAYAGRNASRVGSSAIDARNLVELAGARTVLAVPMNGKKALIGAIIIYRQEVRLFTEKQIELVQNFAAQAVIAIENARLLNELRQSLQQQTATSEVLQVISRFPGDLQPVFEAVLANATGICDAKFGLLWLTDRGGFRCVALHNVPPAFADYYRSPLMIHPASGTGLRRLADTRRVAQVPDMTKIQPYIERDPFVVTSVELGGYRSVVNVPMLKDEELIGAISIYRQLRRQGDIIPCAAWLTAATGSPLAPPL